MIKYRDDQWVLLFSCSNVRSAVSNRAFRFALAIALPCAFFAWGLKFLDIKYEMNLLKSTMPDSNLYSTFTVLLGFLIVFHTSQAYQRYISGCGLLYQMLGDFFDVASILMAFTRCSKAGEEVILRFQHTVCRLFSLLFMTALADLEDVEDGQCKAAYEADLVDPLGIDPDTLLLIYRSHVQPETICQLIQSLIVDGMDNGVLSVPAPLLTRSFQELGNGMIKFHEARKFVAAPYPFCYMAVTEMLLAVHWIFTPFMLGSWTQDPFGAGLFTFVQVFVIWALHGIARELDNPFQRDANDLDGDIMQKEMNTRLVALLKNKAEGTPLISRPVDTLSSSLQVSTTYSGVQLHLDSILQKKDTTGLQSEESSPKLPNHCNAEVGTPATATCTQLCTGSSSTLKQNRVPGNHLRYCEGQQSATIERCDNMSHNSDTLIDKGNWEELPDASQTVSRVVLPTPQPGRDHKKLKLNGANLAVRNPLSHEPLASKGATDSRGRHGTTGERPSTLPPRDPGDGCAGVSHWKHIFPNDRPQYGVVWHGKPSDEPSVKL